MQILPSTSALFERVGLDRLGPFPRSKNNNRYVLVFTEYTTKWVELVACRTGDSHEVADALLKRIILRFRPPVRLLTDQGKEFVNQTVTAVNNRYGIRHLKTSAFHPRTNGLTERFNRTLCNMLAHYVDSLHSNWDELLPYMQDAYNKSKHETTGYSPYFLMFLEEPVLPVDALLGNTSGNDMQDKQFLKIARDIAATRNSLAQLRNKNRYDKKRQHVEYKVGDHVFCNFPNRIIGLSEKLLPQYRGPFSVIEKLAVNNYRIQSTKGKNYDVSVERLRKYRPREQEQPETTTRKTVSFTGCTVQREPKKMIHRTRVFSSKSSNHC